MPQLQFDPNLAAGLPGQLVEGRTQSYPNPVVPQVTQFETEGATTDGTYTVEIRESGRIELAASFLFVASSSTAVQIAQGMVDAANNDSATRGLLNDTGAELADTDDCQLNFRRGGFVYDVTLSSDPSGGTAQITEITAAGFTAVGAGDLIESDGAGGFQQWSGDGPLGLGVVVRNSEVINTPENANTLLTAIDGPSSLDILYDGTIFVTVDVGNAVQKGDGPALYNPTTREWRFGASAGFTIVEGTQFMSNGTGGVQRVRVRLPLES